jgi:hypothetical protein
VLGWFIRDRVAIVYLPRKVDKAAIMGDECLRRRVMKFIAESKMSATNICFQSPWHDLYLH